MRLSTRKHMKALAKPRRLLSELKWLFRPNGLTMRKEAPKPGSNQGWSSTGAR